MKEAKIAKSIIIYWVVLFLRIVIGGTFIFSGFVKAIDPWGSIYKFGDYIFALNLGSLEPYLLILAVFVASLEFIFGVFILTGCYRRFSPIVLIILMAFMVPLTLYLAITDAVPDCGCFGDAIIISNWGTFWKNIAITICLIIILKYNKRVESVFSNPVQWITSTLSLAYILLISFIGYIHQPLIDFRPFKVNSPLISDKLMESSVEENDYQFIYEKNGIRDTFNIDNIPDDTLWTYVDRIEPQSIKNESESGLSIYYNNEDITQTALKKEGEQIILLFPSLGDVEISYTYIINELYDYTKIHNIDMIGLTSTSDQQIKDWIDLSMATYPIYNIDDSTLKQIARGNPAIVYLKDGVIIWKRSLRSIPNELLQNPSSDFGAINDNNKDNYILLYLTTFYFLALIFVLMVNRFPKGMKIKNNWHRKNKNLE